MRFMPSHGFPSDAAGLNERTYINDSHSTPTATWQPCVPVSVKKVVPSRLFEIVIFFTVTNSVNSYTWQPRKIRPKNTVVSSDQRQLFTLPFWIAFTASAIISDDISRMNVENDVSAGAKMCFGSGAPAGGCSR